MISFDKSKDVSLDVAKAFDNVDSVHLYRDNYPSLNKHKYNHLGNYCVLNHFLM